MLLAAFERRGGPSYLAATHRDQRAGTAGEGQRRVGGQHEPGGAGAAGPVGSRSPAGYGGLVLPRLWRAECSSSRNLTPPPQAGQGIQSGYPAPHAARHPGLLRADARWGGR